MPKKPYEEFYEQKLMGLRGQLGQARDVVARKEALIASLQDKSDDEAEATRLLVSEELAEDVFVDRISKRVYRVTPDTLSSGVNNPAGDFGTVTQNAVNQEGTIGEMRIRAGTEYLFGKPRDYHGDVEAPYSYGSLLDVTGSAINTGTLRVRLFDAGGNHLKGTPLTCGAPTLNYAHPSDIRLRRYFNPVGEKRGMEGDIIRVTFESGTSISTTRSSWNFELICLTKLR